MRYLTKRDRYTIVMSIIPIVLWLNVAYLLIMRIEMSVTIPVTVFITLCAFLIWLMTV